MADMSAPPRGVAPSVSASGIDSTRLPLPLLLTSDCALSRGAIGSAATTGATMGVTGASTGVAARGVVTSLVCVIGEVI
jgi:hypothetical protein